MKYLAELFVDELDSSGEAIDCKPVAESSWFASESSAHRWADAQQIKWDWANIECDDPDIGVWDTIFPKESAQ